MSSDTTTIGGGSYRLEPLNAKNWMPWKRRMEAILREAGLDKYVTGSLKSQPDATSSATEHAAWPAGEAKARTRLELAICDEEMVHILGTTTAAEIWDRLCQVKETKGRLGILAT